MAITDIPSLMGGKGVLGFGPPGDHKHPQALEVALAAAVQEGLPLSALDAFVAATPMTMKLLQEAGLSRRTISHSRKRGALSTEQSDHLVRVVRGYARAVETFGTADKAMHWLTRKTRPLGDRRPIELFRTDVGARIVDDLLARIAHGIAA